MFEIGWLRLNIDKVKDSLEKRGYDSSIIDNFLDIDRKRRDLITEVESLRARRNQITNEIEKFKKRGEDISSFFSEVKKIKESIKELEDLLKDVENETQNILLKIPNIPHESVVFGKDSSDNKEIRKWGEPRKFNFQPKPHWEIGENLNILDFERASKLAGSRFAIYYDLGAKLERVLINFMLDIHTKERGYREVLPPFIANEKSLIGTGNLPKFEEDLFRLKDRDWYLIPTAEVPLTNLFRDEILKESELPKRFVAYTPCFRAEAGSWGRDVRGLVRQHQFNKVELMIFSLPENSYEELEKITSDAEEILKRLELPYRVVSLCTGDIGFASAKTYDIEVWMPNRNEFMEISSCSNFEAFQARRANIRFRRNEKGKLEYVHTLNGSGLAIGRTVAAILENYQNEDGSVNVPSALVSYLDGIKVIKKE
ncbi:MAG: serine--tRNA ligase [Candidatus Aminicenantia bacterium]